METIFGIDQVDRPQLRRATSRIRQRERPLRRCSAPTVEISISIRLVPTPYTHYESDRDDCAQCEYLKVVPATHSVGICLFRRFHLKIQRGGGQTSPPQFWR